MPATTRPRIIDAPDYQTELMRVLPHAKERIVIAAMIVLSGKHTDRIFREIQRALQRGVRVRILLDNFTKLTYLYGIRPGKARFDKTAAVLNDLHDLGATVHYVGHIGLVPYRGRCHLKATVVDDDVYSFGGINFFDEAFRVADYMLHIVSRSYADCLEELVRRVGESAGPLPNGEVPIETGASILFDGGGAGSSVIYERACELSARASRVYYVSQMAPSGALATILHSTDFTCYTNAPSLMNAPDAWGQAFDLKRFHTVNAYQGSRYLHAKFMLFELPGGKRAVLSGSHNFSYRGVAFGTQEIALHTTDQGVWDDLHAVVQTIAQRHG
jgi:cardiolipin synthase A/B